MNKHYLSAPGQNLFFFGARRAFALAGLLAGISTASAQIIKTVDFESLPTGSGELVTLAPDSPFSAFGFHFGYTTFTGTATTVLTDDPINGVVASSVINTGKAGYLGGAGTAQTLPAETGSYSYLTFPEAFDAVPVQAAGTQRTVSLDFALERNAGTNQQAFSFFLFDAKDANDSVTYSYHSLVRINADNTVSIANNDAGLGFFSETTTTSVTLLEDTAYHLEIVVDYVTATWSAEISEKYGTEIYSVVDGVSINDGGYTLSGWTSAGSLDIQLEAGDSSEANKSFQDRLLMDNIVFSSVPEPGAFSLVAGAAVLMAALGGRRRMRNRVA
jgi:hypothetical protein